MPLSRMELSSQMLRYLHSHFFRAGGSREGGGGEETPPPPPQPHSTPNMSGAPRKFMKENIQLVHAHTPTKRQHPGYPPET
jgi:hypothetical protein